MIAFLLTLVFFTAPAGLVFYTSPAGSGTACSFTSPCSLETGLTKPGAGDTLYLRGGTYSGKYTSKIAGTTSSPAIVRPYPGERAIIDGYKTTTLTSSVNASTQTIPVASTSGLVSGETIAIDTEMMQIDTVQSPTSLLVNRGWGGSIGGAAAHTSGASVIHAGNQLTVTGSNTIYRDLEIMSSYPQRDLEPGAITGQGCCGFYAMVRGAGISQTAGTGNSYLINFIHDNLDAIFIGGSTSNTTVAGNIISNNGGHHFDPGEGREAGSGHGIYAENASGYSRIYQNIVINNFNFNGQFYGVTGSYVGGDHQDNVFANAGSPLGGLINPAYRNFNVIYGPDSVESPTANIVRNHYWAPHDAIGGTPAYLGYGAGIDQATITDNYFVGGPQTVTIGDISTITFIRNNIFGDSPVLTFINKPATLTGTWNTNTYHKAAGRSVYYIPPDPRDFTTWKSLTGFDAGSTETSVAIPNRVILIPSTYETGRAHVVVYSDSTSININLSGTGLVNGQGYEIRSAFNYFETVLAGIYSSANPIVNVSLTSTVATPIGMSFTPATTPQFAVLVILPTSGSPTPTPTPAPTPAPTPVPTPTPSPSPTPTCETTTWPSSISGQNARMEEQRAKGCWPYFRTPGRMEHRRP